MSEISFMTFKWSWKILWKNWKPRLCWPISISGANRACLVAFSIDSWEAEYSISARTLSSASLKIQCIISGLTDGWGLAGRISYLYLKIPKMVPPRNKTFSTNTSVQSITLKGFENNTPGESGMNVSECIILGPMSRDFFKTWLVQRQTAAIRWVELGKLQDLSWSKSCSKNQLCPCKPL